MYRAVIVDDEALVKFGLLSIVDWNKLGYQIVGQASNGEEGLKLIEEKNPQLVITDIVMQPVDGIKMIEAAIAGGSQAIFVVVSSYDEFELVKKAMKLGAWDYLLKLHIKRETMEDLLCEVAKELEIRSSNTACAAGIGEWERETLRNAFLTELLAGEVKGEENAADRMKQLGIRLLEGNLRVVCLRADIPPAAGRPDDSQAMVETMILNIMRDISGRFFESCCIQWSEREFVMVFSENPCSAEEMENMLTAVIEMIRQYTNIPAAVGLSERFDSIAGLREAYFHAREASKEIFRNGYLRIYDYTKLSEQNDFLAESQGWDQKELIRVCERMDWEAYQRLASALLAETGKAAASRSSICFQCGKFMYSVYECLFEQCQERERLREIEECISRVLHGDTMEHLEDALQSFHHTIIEYMRQRSLNDTSRLIRDAKEYVRSHVKENISLSDTAEYLHISPGYLSALFSRKGKSSFIHYVNEVKVEEAKRLLRQEHMKVYEVSFLLGYENSGYFSRIFKKMAGCTPKEYSEQSK